MIGVWSACTSVRKGWENWAYLAWRRGDLWGPRWYRPSNIYEEFMEKSEPGFSQWCVHGGRRDNGYKWKQDRCWVNGRKAFFPRKTIQQWITLPRMVLQFHLQNFWWPSRIKCWVTGSGLLAGPAHCRKLD